MGQSNVLVKDGKRIPVGAQDDVFVGLDVHTKKVNVAVRVNGEQVARWLSPPGSATIARSLRPLRGLDSGLTPGLLSPAFLKMMLQETTTRTAFSAKRSDRISTTGLSSSRQPGAASLSCLIALTTSA